MKTGWMAFSRGWKRELMPGMFLIRRFNDWGEHGQRSHIQHAVGKWQYQLSCGFLVPMSAPYHSHTVGYICWIL